MTSVLARPPTQHRRHGTPARWSWAWVALSSVAVAAYFVGQYADGTLTELAGREVGLASTYADRPWPIQVAFYIHIIAAGLALTAGPFQFFRWLRRRTRAVHRWTGRIYVVAVIIGAAAGLVVSAASSVGMLGFFGFGSLAVLWAWTTWRGYRAMAHHRDFRSHQAWMIRSFALTYAAVTLRLWFGALLLIQLPFSNATFQTIFDNAYAPLPFLCWLPNIVVAEILIRRRGLPALRLDATTQRTAT